MFVLWIWGRQNAEFELVTKRKGGREKEKLELTKKIKTHRKQLKLTKKNQTNKTILQLTKTKLISSKMKLSLTPRTVNLAKLNYDRVWKRHFPGLLRTRASERHHKAEIRLRLLRPDHSWCCPSVKSGTGSRALITAICNGQRVEGREDTHA